VSRPQAETPCLPIAGHEVTQFRAKLGVNKQTGLNPVKNP
jgi:hypothetical protein